MKLQVHTITVEEAGETVSIKVSGSQEELVDMLIKSEVSEQFQEEAKYQISLSPGVLDLPCDYFSPKVAYTYTVEEIEVPAPHELLDQASRQNDALEEEAKTWQRRAWEAQAKAKHYRTLISKVKEKEEAREASLRRKVVTLYEKLGFEVPAMPSLLHLAHLVVPQGDKAP